MSPLRPRIDLNSRPIFTVSRLVLRASILLVLLACSNASLKVKQASSQNSVSVKIANYCPTSNFQLISTFAWNHSAVYENQNWASDFDRDMLSDNFELTRENMSQFNIGFSSSDSNSD